MSPTERFDAHIVDTTERYMRVIESRAGWSNFTFLRMCSGAYAVVLLTLLLVHTFSDNHRDVLMLIITMGSFAWALYFSLFTCDRLEEEAQVRMAHNKKNERRSERTWRHLRLAMLASFILLAFLFAYIAYRVPNFYEHRGLALYMFVCGASALLLSLCLFLEVCDPLPRSQHSA